MVLMFVVILTAFALFLRIQYVGNTVVANPIIFDAKQYVTYGYNLAHHRVFSMDLSSVPPTPDSYRSPGYPALIALAFLVFESDNRFYDAVRYLQCVLSAMLVPLTYLLGVNFLSRRWAAASAALVVFSPHLISMCAYLLTETLFGFLMLTAVYCFVQALAQKGSTLFCLAGALFGMACMVNETVFFLPFLFACVTAFYPPLKRRFQNRSILKPLGLFLVFFLILPGAWMLRNTLVLPPGAPTAGQRALSTLSHGTYPGFIYKTERFKYFPYREDPMQPAFGTSLNTFLSVLWARFKERPIRYLSWYLLEKPYHLWGWNFLQGQGDVYVYPVKTSWYHTSYGAYLSKFLMRLMHPLLVGMSLLGILLAAFAGPRRLPRGNGYDNWVFLLIVLLYYTVLYSIFAPWPRYSVPLRPLLFVWALISLNHLKQIIYRKTNEKQSRVGDHSGL